MKLEYEVVNEQGLIELIVDDLVKFFRSEESTESLKQLIEYGNPVIEWTLEKMIRHAKVFTTEEFLVEQGIIVPKDLNDLIQYCAESLYLDAYSCGLNADWSCEAWQLDSDFANDAGEFFILDAEEDNKALLVQRINLDDPDYKGDGFNDQIIELAEGYLTISGISDLMKMFKNIVNH
jgi:hypothetical protein